MSKLVIGVIIGIILGGVIGYTVSSASNQSEIADLRASLQNQITDLTVSQEAITSSLQDSLDESATEYESLSSMLDDLIANYEKLEEDYIELENQHEELLDDYSLVLGKVPLTPDQTSTVLIEREYSWTFQGKTWTIDLAIPQSIADFYIEQERVPTDDYSVYVTHPFDDDYLRTIIEEMNVIAIHEDYTEAEKVNLLISFIQSLPYTYDNVSTPYDEYPRYPIETLLDNGGDCEDSSILTASLLYSMGYDVILINPPAHMAVGVNIEATGSYWEHDGATYYYLETTGEGWAIGECPDEYLVSAYLYPLIPMPVITHNWEASWGNGKLDISITVMNMGTTIAEGYSVWVAFDAGDDMVWNPVESDPFDLQFGREVTIDLTLDLPANENTRLIIDVLHSDGYYISQSFSKWFDT